MKVARALGRLERERPPHQIEPAIERRAGRHHADDGVRLAVERQLAADDGGIAAKLCRPQPVAQDDDVLLPRLILIGPEGATERRLDSKDVEIAGRHAACAHERRLLDA